MTLPRVALVLVGVVSIIVALMGLWYNLSALDADFSTVIGQLDLPYFYPAFYIMSAICVTCYFLLLYVGVQLIRGSTTVFRLLLLVVLFEILYFFSIGILWNWPEYGLSIAGATGVANGGLMIQGVVLFPIWAPLVAWFASKKMREPNKQSLVRPF
jgi:hypothetical protein